MTGPEAIEDVIARAVGLPGTSFSDILRLAAALRLAREDLFFAIGVAKAIGRPDLEEHFRATLREMDEAPQDDE